MRLPLKPPPLTPPPGVGEGAFSTASTLTPPPGVGEGAFSTASTLLPPPGVGEGALVQLPYFEIRRVVGRRPQRGRWRRLQVCGPDHVPDVVPLVEGHYVRFPREHGKGGLSLRVVVEGLVVVPDINRVGRIGRDIQPDARHRQHA